MQFLLLKIFLKVTSKATFADHSKFKKKITRSELRKMQKHQKVHGLHVESFKNSKMRQEQMETAAEREGKGRDAVVKLKYVLQHPPESEKKKK